MAHQPGWIELYGALEEDLPFSQELVDMALAGRTSGMGETMLHWYAIEGDPQIVRKLIELGFEVNVTNMAGRSPLFEAVQLQRWKMAEVLLEKGADLEAADEEGDTIFEFLSDMGREDDVRILQKLAGKT